MEALAAIGLASNVLQFTEYTSKLFFTAQQLYRSATGTTGETQELERVHKSLRAFSVNFIASNGFHAPIHAEELISESHATALRNLATDCKAVCDELIEVLERLRLADGRWRAFASFKVAMKSMHGNKKIAEMEARIDRFQKAIASHFLPILRYDMDCETCHHQLNLVYSAQQSALMGAVISLRNESYRLSFNQSEKIGHVFEKLSHIEDTLREQQQEDEGQDVGIMAPSASDHQSPQLLGHLRPTSGQSDRTAAKMQVLAESMSSISLTQKTLQDIAREQAFLASLTFPSRPVRHDSIPLAHRETFKWALKSVRPSSPLEGQENDRGQTRLASWLVHGDGIFWVSGKAGSGKSTLMKFIVDHAQTESMLQEWAHPKQAVLASHFFWTAGTSMQKSELGLLRTLLYDVFRICPDLIPETCAERWTEAGTATSCFNTEWTSHELMGILKRIARASSMQVRFCFFVDGLDEFEGNHDDLSATLQALAGSKNFKICLSSRPWNIFEDLFGHDTTRKLYIHELTQKDIQRFTTSRLEGHPLWNSSRFNSNFKASIIEEITERAQGVFLWVFLVTNSLRNGLSNGDTKFDLHSRLRSLPTDLDKFFKHMLGLVDPIYWEKMAHTLRIAINAKEPLHFLIFNMIEQEYDKSQSEELWCDLNDLDKIIMDPEEYECDQCRRRINARCGGLMSINPSGKVEFLHRTVRDFLLLREISDYLEAKSSVSFKPNIITLRAFISVVQTNPDSFAFRFLGRRETLRQALQYANDALEEDHDAAFAELEGFNLWAHSELFETNSESENTSPLEQMFRQEVLKAGIEEFVHMKLQDSKSYFDNLGYSPLNLVLKEGSLTPKHIRIVASLIKADKTLKIHDPVSKFI